MFFGGDNGVDDNDSAYLCESVATADDASAFMQSTTEAFTSVASDSAGDWDDIWVPMMGVFSTVGTDDFTLYVEDAAHVSTQTGGRVIGTVANIMLGRRATATSPMNGLLAEPCIWDSALTAGNFTSLVGGANPTTIDGSNLKAYYPLDSDTGSSVPDVSGNSGPTLTVTGTVAYNADHPTVDALPSSGLPGYHGLNRGIGRGLFRGLG